MNLSDSVSDQIPKPKSVWVRALIERELAAIRKNDFGEVLQEWAFEVEGGVVTASGVAKSEAWESLGLIGKPVRHGTVAEAKEQGWFVVNDTTTTSPSPSPRLTNTTKTFLDES